jgi:hypothetical protein
MQQVELLAVAIILWGDIFLFLLYLLLRMRGIEKQLKIVESQVEGDQ